VSPQEEARAEQVRAEEVESRTEEAQAEEAQAPPERRVIFAMGGGGFTM